MLLWGLTSNRQDAPEGCSQGLLQEEIMRGEGRVPQISRPLAHLLVPGYATLVSSPRRILSLQFLHRSSQLAASWEWVEK